MCHFSCPVAETEKNEAYTPWGKQQTAKLIREEKIPLNAENALSAYKCLTCRSSTRFCDHEIVVADSLQQIREKAVENKVAPDSVQKFEEKFRKQNNPYEVDLQARVLKVLPPDLKKNKGEVLFFPTCHLASSEDLLKKTFSLFKKLKVDFLKVFDDSIQCCGYSLSVLGFKKEFQELAEIQYHALKSAKTIVVGSPECAWSLKEVYPSIGLNLKSEILTLPEFVAGRLKGFAFHSKAETKQKYFYHDSCYMGRYLGQYEAPREILEMITGFAPQEFSCNKEKGLCSGAGGGYPIISPEAANKIPEEHFKEMKEKEVKTIVTACPQAYSHFKKTGKEIVVKDFISFIEESLLP